MLTTSYLLQAFTMFFNIPAASDSDVCEILLKLHQKSFELQPTQKLRPELTVDECIEGIIFVHNNLLKSNGRYTGE